MIDPTNINFDLAQLRIRLVNNDPTAPADFLRQIALLECDYQLLCESYVTLTSASNPKIAGELIQSGAAIAKLLNWNTSTLRRFWLICAQMLASGIVFEYHWSDMAKILDASKVAAIALSMTEAEFKQAIEARVIRAETFLPAFAQQLQVEFGESKGEGDRH